MSTPKRRLQRGIQAVVFLAAMVLAGMAIALSTPSPKADPPPRHYSVPFSVVSSQITAGASYSTGGSYSAKDVLRVAGPEELHQSSGSYVVLDVLLDDGAPSSRPHAGVAVWREY
jgi:hypothetical protein